MKIKKIKDEYQQEDKKNIRKAISENFTYGFLGSIIVVFITQEIDMAVLIAYLMYYFYVGKVINRPKYVTSLGKFIVFPIPTALGAFTGYKLAGILSEILQTYYTY